MDWKLYDVDGKFIQEVNCQYDSLDIALFDHEATEVRVDFKEKKAYIVEKEDVYES